MPRVDLDKMELDPELAMRKWYGEDITSALKNIVQAPKRAFRKISERTPFPLEPLGQVARGVEKTLDILFPEENIGNAESAAFNLVNPGASFASAWGRRAVLLDRQIGAYEGQSKGFITDLIREGYPGLSKRIRNIFVGGTQTLRREMTNFNFSEEQAQELFREDTFGLFMGYRQNIPPSLFIRDDIESQAVLSAIHELSHAAQEQWSRGGELFHGMIYEARPNEVGARMMQGKVGRKIEDEVAGINRFLEEPKEKQIEIAENIIKTARGEQQRYFGFKLQAYAQYGGRKVDPFVPEKSKIFEKEASRWLTHRIMHDIVEPHFTKKEIAVALKKVLKAGTENRSWKSLLESGLTEKDIILSMGDYSANFALSSDVKENAFRFLGLDKPTVTSSLFFKSSPAAFTKDFDPILNSGYGTYNTPIAHTATALKKLTTVDDIMKEKYKDLLHPDLARRILEAIDKNKDKILNLRRSGQSGNIIDPNEKAFSMWSKGYKE